MAVRKRLTLPFTEPYVFLVFQDRPPDSPVVERVWRSHSERAGTFHSIAASHWELVVSRCQGKLSLTVRGPESVATTADCPADGEWLAIEFRLGTFMPLFAPTDVRDRQDLTLPDATGRSFWLDGSAWEYPDFDNAETFVNRLVRRGLIATDPAVVAVVNGQASDVTTRTEQRRFLRTTGLTHAAIRQIERARHATNLLRQGVPIVQVAHDAGYFDQAHLTRSLTRFIGQTPGEIARGERQLSYLYNTAPR